MKLDFESVGKVVGACVAYVNWCSAIGTDDFEEIKKWKEAWNERLCALSTEELLAYIDCDILNTYNRP